MATLYPGGLDTGNLPPVYAGNLITAQHHNNQSDAILAIEATLGINPQGAHSTVGAAIASAAQLVPTKEAVRVATASALPSSNFDTDVIAAVSAGPLTIDGIAVSMGDRVLVKNEAGDNQLRNGLYVVTDAGSPTTWWSLERTSDMDTATEALGALVYVLEGTTNASTLWALSTPGPITLDTTPLTFTQIAGPGTYTAGTGLTLTGTQFAVDPNISIQCGTY